MKTNKFLIMTSMFILAIFMASCGGGIRTADNSEDQPAQPDNGMNTDEQPADNNMEPDEPVLSAPLELPESWPDEITIMPGMEIITGEIPEQFRPHPTADVVVLWGDVPVGDIVDHYNSIPGWSVSRPEWNERGRWVSITPSKDDHHLSVQMDDRTGETFACISYWQE